MENFLEEGTEKTYSKAVGLTKKTCDMDPDDYGAKLLYSILCTITKNKTYAKESLKICIPKLEEYANTVFDKIQIKNGILFLNDKAINRQSIGLWSAKDRNNVMYTYDKYEEKLSDSVVYEVLDASPNGMLDNTDVYTVPEGHFFAMGDNRDQSSDSRILSQLGFIPFENLVGKAQIIFYSRDREESLWKLWLWPSSIRVERLFKSI